MKFKFLLLTAMSAVVTLATLTAPAAADALITESVSVTAEALGGQVVQNGLRFTELEDGTYEVGYDCNGKKPIGTVTIPETVNGRRVTRIAEAGFYGCDGLTGITVPDSITSAGANAFIGTPFLKSQSGTVKYAGKIAVYCDPEATSVTVANGTLGLADRLFYLTENLKTAVLPDSLINIGNMTFDGCSKLTSVNIPGGLTTIGSGVFSGCTALKNVTIPPSITSIGSYAFESCGITAADLTNVVKIGKGAFENSKLAENGVTAGTQYMDIGGRAFAGTTFYSKLGREKYLGTVFIGCVADTESVALRSGTTAVADMAFCGLANLTAVSIPGSVRTIGADAFFNCPKLASVTIAEGVESIGEDAFRLCGGLKTLSLPISLSSSGQGAFYGCDALATVTYPGSIFDWAAITAEDGYSLPAAVPTFGTAPTAPDPVTGLKLSGVTDSTATLTWNRHSIATGYRVDVCKNDKWTTVGTVTGLSTTVTGLSQYTDYKFRVTALVHSVPSTPAQVTGKTKLTSITGVRVTPAANTITITWTRNNIADSYRVDIYDGGTWTMLTRTASNLENQYKATGLKPGTEYKFRIYAANGNEYSTATEIETATTAPPEQPSGVKASTNYNSATLSWNVSKFADSYQIDVFQNGTWKFVAKTSGTSYTVTGLSPKTTYMFRVFAFNGDLYSSSTSVAATTPAAVRPAAVTGFKGSPSANSVKLTWNKSSAADSYQVDIYKNGAWTFLTRTSDTSFTAAGLAEKTSYQFRIFAFNGDLYSSSAKVTVKTTSSASSKPTAVTGFSASPASTSVKLTWNKNSTADSYQIDIYKNGAWSYLTKTTGTSYTATGLSSGKSYQFRIFAFKGSAYSSSAKVTVSTTSGTSSKPTAVTGFKGSPSSNSVKLTWNKNSTADSYQIDIYKNGAWSYLTKTTGTSYTATGLSSGKSYQFRIFAFKGSAYSSSAKVTVSTTSSASSKPTAVTGFKGSSSSNSVKLTWNKNSTADSYQIDIYKNGAWSYLTKTTGTSYTATGLSSGKSYQFRIFAFKGSAYSSSAKVTVSTTSGTSSKPTAVTGFKGSSSSNSVKLTWNKNSTADSYQIDYYIDGKWYYLAKTTGTSYNVTGLTSGKSYQFRIFAFKGSAYSSSAKATVTTLSANAPTAVTGLSADTTATAITLSWNKNSTADSYQIDYYINGKWYYLAKTTGTSHTIKDLTPNKSYQFRVFAFKGSAYSPSAKITAMTGAVRAPALGGPPAELSGVYTKLKGIDVSGWQGTIDFNAVKQSGVDFVIVKAGEEYITVESWETNYANAKKAGLMVGAYWYSYAVTTAEARKEAQTFIAAMKGKQFDFPVYFDIERSEQFDLGVKACSEIIDAFCSELESAGYYAGVYCSTYWYTNYASQNIRLKRPAWIADYRGRCYYDAACGMWQYGYGKVSGVESDDCDLNWGYVDYSRYIKANRLNGY